MRTRTPPRPIDWTRPYFTPGLVCRLCGVSPRTVANWIDSGRLKGIRIPGCLDRRVSRRALTEFLVSSGYEVPRELAGDRRVVLVGSAAPELAGHLPVGWLVEAVATDLDAAAAVGRVAPAAAVLSLPDLGRRTTVSLAQWLAAASPTTTVVAVGAGDDGADAAALAPLGVAVVPRLADVAAAIAPGGDR